MGMIAYEVARTFSSDPPVTNEILKMLSDVDKTLFKKMDIDRRTNWLVAKWGFSEEFEAFEKEMTAVKLKDQLGTSIKE